MEAEREKHRAALRNAVKSVYLRMKDHKYEDFEPQYMNKVKEFLYGEISKQFEIDPEDVEKFVCSEVKKSLDGF